VRVWNKFNWLRTGSNSGICEQYNIHFHENKPNPSDVLFTVTEKVSHKLGADSNLDSLSDLATKE
jgi:hypothetical protein